MSESCSKDQTETPKHQCPGSQKLARDCTAKDTYVYSVLLRARLIGTTCKPQLQKTIFLSELVMLKCPKYMGSHIESDEMCQPPKTI